MRTIQRRRRPIRYLGVLPDALEHMAKKSRQAITLRIAPARTPRSTSLGEYIQWMTGIILTDKMIGPPPRAIGRKRSVLDAMKCSLYLSSMARSLNVDGIFSFDEIWGFLQSPQAACSWYQNKVDITLRINVPLYISLSLQVMALPPLVVSMCRYCS